jgi:hypothetical protein
MPTSLLMRAQLLVIILLISITTGMADSSLPSPTHEKKNTSAREADFTVSNPQVVHIHKDETKEVSLIWHNLKSEQIITDVSMQQPLNSISVAGLPSEGLEMDSGALGQLLFTLTADSDANLGIQTINLEWRHNSSQELFYSMSINISVDIESSLGWGSAGSTFNVNPDTPFSFALNLSNNGTTLDEPLIKLEGDVGWRIQWDLGEEPWNGSQMSIGAGAIGWVNIQVWVPPVINGSPTAGEGLTWSMTATSSLDSAVSSYSFTIIPKTFHNATIDWHQGNISLDPEATGKLQLKVRNVGNSQSRIEIEIMELDQNGLPIGEKVDILNISGWTFRISTEYNASLLAVNTSALIDISILAPASPSSSAGIRVRAYSPSAPTRSASVDMFANIELIRNGSINLDGLECRSIKPSETCSGSLIVTNSGNYIDSFVLFSDSPEWLVVNKPSSQISLPKGESVEVPGIEITVDEGIEAFTQAEVTWKLRSVDGDILDTLKINISIALDSNWVFEEVVQEVDADGLMTMSCTVKNLGNGKDGLIVVLTVSHYTEHGLNPPNGADYELDADPLRDFQIIDIEYGQNITFRSWAKLPADELLNGTLWMNVSMWSFSDPDGNEINTSTSEDWLGTPWQPDQPVEEEPWFDFAPMFGFIDETWSRHSYTFFAIIFSVFAIHIAMQRRRKIVEDQRSLTKLEEARKPKPAEEFSEIESKFAESGEKQVELVESPSMDAEAFSAAFSLSSGPRKQSSATVEGKLVEAAATVLDHHDAKKVLSQMDEMAANLMSTGSSTAHSSNLDLPDVNSENERTTRHDPKGLMESKKVPLPKNDNLDDLDI